QFRTTAVGIEVERSDQAAAHIVERLDGAGDDGPGGPPRDLQPVSDGIEAAGVEGVDLAEALGRDAELRGEADRQRGDLPEEGLADAVEDGAEEAGRKRLDALEEGLRGGRDDGIERVAAIALRDCLRLADLGAGVQEGDPELHEGEDGPLALSLPLAERAEDLLAEPFGEVPPEYGEVVDGVDESRQAPGRCFARRTGASHGRPPGTNGSLRGAQGVLHAREQLNRATQPQPGADDFILAAMG